MKELIGHGAYGSIYKEDNFIYKEIPATENLGYLLAQIKRNVYIQNVYDIPHTYQINFFNDKYIVKKDYVTGTNFMDYLNSNQADINNLVKKMVEKQNEFNNIEVKLDYYYQDKIIKSLDMISLDLNLKEEIKKELVAMEKNKTLCHGDYHPYNILVKDDKELAVIDWDNAINGNKLFDIARTFILCYMSSKEFAELYLEKVKEIVKINMLEFKDYLKYIAIECMSEKVNCKDVNLLMKFIKKEVLV